jgi:Flp pilus assembly protein TadB
MKNLLFIILIFNLICVNSELQAALSVPSSEYGLKPTERIISKKEQTQRLKALKKEYRQEMKGMSKVEKKEFIEDKIKKENARIPRMNLLIIGAILILAGIIFYLIPFLWYIGALLQTAGAIVLLVWLILWLMDMA